jgi:hypothetical protein
MLQVMLRLRGTLIKTTKGKKLKTALEVIAESELEFYLQSAKGIAFDTCHKIYVLMDDEQMALMREYGYDTLITSDEMSEEEMYRTVSEWYEDSCSLRFIQAVETNQENPNAGFSDIVAQGAEWEDEDDEDEEE